MHPRRTITPPTSPKAIPSLPTPDTIGHLGATGIRGWMHTDTLVTYDARQIYVTQVDPGSPADGIMAVGDVILGVDGKLFSYDPRTEFGKALTQAESEAGGGNLTITRWRAGKTEDVALKLAVLGSYSATAPYDCEKSRNILARGCKTLAERIPATAERENPIPRSLNALALLASGNPEYLPILKKEAEWAAEFSNPEASKPGITDMSSCSSANTSWPPATSPCSPASAAWPSKPPMARVPSVPGVTATPCPTADSADMA